MRDLGFAEDALEVGHRAADVIGAHQGFTNEQAANSCGGVMGKMIDAQSIVVSSTATQQVGKEAAIFKAVFVHSIVLASLVGLIVMLYAFVFPGAIPF